MEISWLTIFAGIIIVLQVLLLTALVIGLIFLFRFYRRIQGATKGVRKVFKSVVRVRDEIKNKKGKSL